MDSVNDNTKPVDSNSCSKDELTEVDSNSCSKDELTEVDPKPASEDESISMKVSDNDSGNETRNGDGKTDPHVQLMKMPVNNQNDALNCLIGFVGIAQRRGVFALDEAAKAFQCVQMFYPENNKKE